MTLGEVDALMQTSSLHHAVRSVTPLEVSDLIAALPGHLIFSRPHET
jgi:hypothetical protein